MTSLIFLSIGGCLEHGGKHCCMKTSCINCGNCLLLIAVAFVFSSCLATIFPRDPHGLNVAGTSLPGFHIMDLENGKHIIVESVNLNVLMSRGYGPRLLTSAGLLFYRNYLIEYRFKSESSADLYIDSSIYNSAATYEELEVTDESSLLERYFVSIPDKRVWAQKSVDNRASDSRFIALMINLGYTVRREDLTSRIWVSKS